MLKKSPRSYLYAMYKNDMDYGQTYYDEVGYDNIFALAFRKSEVPIKLMKVHQQQLDHFKEWRNGFSVTTSLHRKIFNPLVNLPPASSFPDGKNGEALNNFEVSLKFRFAYLEKYLENNFFRTSLGSDYPIPELRIAQGIPGVLKSNYTIRK
jgi:hypothetical protein